MIEKMELTMTNGTVHHFKRGEFGVENIKVDKEKCFILVSFSEREFGKREIIIPLQNVEKCEYLLR
ncbi:MULTISPECIES: hypothetical protein [Methanothermobacter]|uniref:Uncharacterized protein n=1 Tax=Methanothermobacter marburgensis (strain ATCC BAA-927 / DSM 2133 / JCM 14651 / NBRC 100331 / OCM 82 / Marburg) TaxID=79929 RepID=D9PV00_METTM|nr:MULTISPECIES: hypothetical protein [Methanothermobacter]ADL58047.1 conserved hypothetical protein [Methanothermobacter marburgensis str. Marburg]MCG2829366.1 hypothetical protein [Methanothermobacter sp. K4]MDI9615253.1 hypothetical protein [Methanothermobacter sp.]QEF94093.1 hypothetical protein FVF72_02330 [Methanothermobacter sp. KEPCO-1]QHN08483.1 hypothetical protein FZP68_06935 [Methanothermobacter sp. THM-2]